MIIAMQTIADSSIQAISTEIRIASVPLVVVEEIQTTRVLSVGNPPPTSSPTDATEPREGADHSFADRYNIKLDSIEKDLTVETPQWILSAYGPGRDAPGQLFGGALREQSFEEMRLHYVDARAAGNEQQAVCSHAGYSSRLSTDWLRSLLKHKSYGATRRSRCRMPSVTSTKPPTSSSRPRGTIRTVSIFAGREHRVLPLGSSSWADGRAFHRLVARQIHSVRQANLFLQLLEEETPLPHKARLLGSPFRWEPNRIRLAHRRSDSLLKPQAEMHSDNHRSQRKAVPLANQVKWASSRAHLGNPRLWAQSPIHSEPLPSVKLLRRTRHREARLDNRPKWARVARHLDSPRP